MSKQQAGVNADARTPAIAEALRLLQHNQLDEAISVCESILAITPDSADALEIIGIARLQQGRAVAAVDMLRKVATLRPGNLNATGNLCAALLTAKQHDEALLLAEGVLKVIPAQTQALITRGVALQGLGRVDEALESYRAAMATDRGNADAANNAGTLLGAKNQHVEAINCFRVALAARPVFPEASNNLGVSLAATGDQDAAIDCYRSAVANRPAYLDAHKNLAELLAKLGRYDESLSAYDAAIRLAPDLAELISNRSTVLNALNRHAEALPGYDRALALKPDFADAWNNRGITLNALNRFEEALSCFRRALEINPEYVNAHWNESLTLLRLGRYAEGWAKHEWRWKKPEFAPHKLDLNLPRWDGAGSLQGKTILLLAEQGFGDTIQFARYVPLLEQRGAKVLLFVPEPLVSLLRTSFPNALVFSRTDAFPPSDYYCPLVSLPLAFGTLLESVPESGPYIKADPAKLRAWRERIPATRELQVGLVWAGSGSHKNDVNRSIPLAMFEPILATPGVRFYSLQKELRNSDARPLASAASNLTTLAAALADFSDTAAAIAALDLVISVDTSVAHLSAAMGKPTWLLLPYVSDWRWIPGTSRNAWYPEAVLFWQPAIGEWSPAISAVAARLSGFAPARRETTSADAPAPVGIDQAISQAAAFLRTGNAADCEAICQGVLTLQPDHPDAVMLLGSVRLRQGLAKDAVTLFARASKLRPASVEALANLAGALRQDGRHADAINCYDRAIQMNPGAANLHSNRGISLLAMRKFDEAEAAINRALALEPGNLAALNNMGVALNEQGRPREALEFLDRALQLNPSYMDSLNNRGLSLIKLNRHEDAERNYRAALQIDARYADGYNNLGLALAGMNRNVEAIACFKKAQEYRPGYIDAHWNESLINLVQGNFQDGWKQYEWRWKKPEFAPHKREFHVPQWTGASRIDGKTIFIHAEQGFGDTIQFIRYCHALIARGAKVLASVPEPLKALLAESFPDVAFYSGSEVLPPFDLHSPLLSLPLCFSTTAPTIPAYPSYLRTPSDRLTKWQGRFQSVSTPRVGVVWSGNPKHQNDTNRSLPASTVALMMAPGCQFFSLQRDVPPVDAGLLTEAGAVMLGSEFSDFSDTAAAISNLDLVISVDTSVAHLAGALGKPVWLLLPFAADWRWLTARSDSPWYPTARLFRQIGYGAELELARTVRDELTRFAKDARRSPR